MKPTLLFIGLVIALAIPAAAKKQRDWQIGHVVDEALQQGPQVTTSTTDQEHTSPGISGPLQTSSKTTSQTTTTTGNTERHLTMIVGREYTYYVRDVGLLSKRSATLGAVFGAAGTALHHIRCRFVIGEDIQYVQEKGMLRVIDADKQECGVEIVRQERRTPSVQPIRQ